ncbi:Silent information regulator protein Sir2 [Oscillochloris trichoides DG-6]|uniref:NAD-dependent protein deacylase n=1 Tax=Oscillochloris trichoides DG-6 TaxID=765420 RepID=E1IAP5_9CHLR|nr:NAD-dependent deacylase [Oscillochloris trichoides]EFO81724.1 Silent information regulator protein Sir2 [Oscillochloris trichoides DG-6]
MQINPQLVTILQRAQSVTVLTGAGVSAESGIPTFRDAQTGMWANFNPEELASPDGFRRNPKLVWEWYAWRRELVQQAQPNPGHLALVELERRMPTFTLITQNVDGLHQRAGSQKVIELHGNIGRVTCSAEGTQIDSWDTTAESVPPRCPHCGAYLRPDVVWFGEMLPRQALQAAWDAAEMCDLFLSVGTSGVVEPAASLPRVARQAGATVAVINLDVQEQNQPPIFSIHARSGEWLPALVRAAWPSQE